MRVVTDRYERRTVVHDWWLEFTLLHVKQFAHKYTHTMALNLAGYRKLSKRARINRSATAVL